MNNNFPMLNTGYIYLDNGATTWKPEPVIKKINEYYNDFTANAHRGDYDISLRVDNEYEGARKIVADFINSDYKEVIFTSGTTDALNLVAEGYFRKHLQKDDEIIINYAEHASNVMPWFRLANDLGVKVKFAALNDSNALTLDSIKEAVSDKTKLISLAMITNVIGDLRDVKEIVKFAHERGIKVVVDGAQSVPHIKTDVKDLDCDFLAFSGHKMCGPTGIGVLYGKYELLEEMEPRNLGGGMNASFDSPEEIELKSIPTRFEAGTPNIEGAIGLGAAIKYLESIGMDNIQKHEVELKKYLVDELSKIEHIKMYNKDTISGTVVFNVDGIFSQDVAIYLSKYKICVRAGNHCAKLLKNKLGTDNTVRVSIYIYNTKEDVDKLVSLLQDKNKILNEML